MKPLSRWFGCLTLAVAALGTTVVPASALEVLGCFTRGTGDISLGINDDPANCPAANRLDAISAMVGLENSTPTATPAVPSPLVLTKNVDQTSPALFLVAARGQQLPAVLVVFFDGIEGRRGNRILSILLTNALVVQMSDSALDQKKGGPVEQVSFAYAKLLMRDDASGTTGCFDFINNVGC